MFYNLEMKLRTGFEDDDNKTKDDLNLQLRVRINMKIRSSIIFLNSTFKSD